MAGVAPNPSMVAVTARVPAGLTGPYEVILLAHIDGVNETEWTAYAALPGGRRMPVVVTVTEDEEEAW